MLRPLIGNLLLALQLPFFSGTARISSLPLQEAASVLTTSPMTLQMPEIINTCPSDLGYVVPFFSTTPMWPQLFAILITTRCVTCPFSVELRSKHHFPIVWPVPNKRLSLLLFGFYTIPARPPTITLVFPAVMSYSGLIFHSDPLGMEEHLFPSRVLSSGV